MKLITFLFYNQLAKKLKYLLEIKTSEFNRNAIEINKNRMYDSFLRSNDRQKHRSKWLKFFVYRFSELDHKK